MSEKKTLSYYNYSKILSFNAIYNLIIGNRGKGKTFGIKKKAIKDAIIKGHQFIYVRRFKEELAIARSTFFDDIREYFPGYDFKLQGKNCYWSHAVDRGMKDREWNLMGCFVALTQAQNFKSANFPRVKTVIFDEFILETNSQTYLRNEVNIFNNLYSTIDRWKDKTRVFFLANSVSAMNPYFIEWKIVPSEDTEFIIKKDGFVICHIDNNQEFNDQVYDTKFGRFIQGTEYGNYAVENQFSDNHSEMLGIKDHKARYLFSLETKTGLFSVWYSFIENHYWVYDSQPKTPIIYTLDSHKMTTEKTLLTFSDKPLQNMRTAYRQARMVFESAVTRETFMEIFKR